MSGEERFIGEAAVSQLSNNAANTALVGEALCSNDALRAHRSAKLEGDSLQMQYAGETVLLERAALVAALVRKCGALAKATLGADCASAAVALRLALSVPPCWDLKQRAVLRDGACAARLSEETPQLVRSDACLREVYALRHAVSIEYWPGYALLGASVVGEIPT